VIGAASVLDSVCALTGGGIAVRLCSRRVTVALEEQGDIQLERRSVLVHLGRSRVRLRDVLSLRPNCRPTDGPPVHGQIILQAGP
jgi:hypothetical protein